jgi:carboxyl-terminal processing protease
MTPKKEQSIVLPSQARARIVRAIEKLVRNKFVNVAGIDLDRWSRNLQQQTNSVQDGHVQDFENAIRQVLAELKTSHTGFYHGIQNRFLPQHSINATLTKCESIGNRWVFVDVFPDGPADRAGIRSGTSLVTVNGVEPPMDSPPQFQMGKTHQLTLTDAEGEHIQEVAVEVPLRKGTKQRPPVVEPKAVAAEFIAPNIGLLRIPYFSGAAGMRFGAELAKAMTGLKTKGADRLVVDLRGNIGGSLGFAILASYLCPDERPIGYSITPQALRNGFSKERLPKVRMPRNKFELLLTLGAFALRDKSVVLMTQGLGPQPFHRRVAILINEFTHSAGEMIASFAGENRLALLVGGKTAGNVLGAVNSAVGYGYFVRLPVFGWFNWSGAYLEGIGVRPDITVARNLKACGSDDQLTSALHAVRTLNGQGSGTD